MKTWGFDGVSNNILQIYKSSNIYCHRTSLCLLAIFKTNKITNTGSCTPTEWWKREATMGFLTIFYKYINPAIFYCHRTSLCLLAIFKTNKISNTGSCTPTEWWKREATMGFLTTFYKYIIQQYFTVTAPHSVFSQYIKQTKYQILVVVHPQSHENVRIRWGF